jgi:hypothetical protein
LGTLLVHHAFAQTKLSEGDSDAQALGYKEDASRTDVKQYGNYKVGETCANCVQYAGKQGEARGPCAAFGGKTVAAKGWCIAWVKKS